MTETKNSLSLGRIGRIVRILLLFAGACQVLFGLAYLAANLGKMQNYGETYELLDAGKSLVFDDRTGLIYPLILAAADLFHGITGVPFMLPVQILQLVLAYISSSLVLKSFCNVTTGNRLYVETAKLFLLTSAPLLQLHLSGLPYSLALSVLCVQYAVTKRAFGKEYEKKMMWQWLLLFVLEELILPWTGFLGALFALICLLFTRGEKKIRIRGLLVAAVLLICFHVLTGSCSLKPGNRGKMQNSPIAIAACHLTWSRLADNYFFWDEEIKEIFSEEDAVAVTNTESLVLTDFGATVDAEYGYFGAQKIYLHMIANVFQNRTREVVSDQIADLKSYGFMPVTVFLNLKGYGRSQTGFHVGRLREHSPELGSLLLMISLYLIPISILLSGAVITLLSKKMVNINPTFIFAAFVISVVITAFSGYFPFDYRRGYLLWYLMEIPGAFAMVSATEGERKLLW